MLRFLTVVGVFMPQICFAAAAIVCNVDRTRCYGGSTWDSKPAAISEAMLKCRKDGVECSLTEASDQPCVGWFRAPSGRGLHSVGPSYTYVVNDGTGRCEATFGQECTTYFVYCN